MEPNELWDEKGCLNFPMTTYDVSATTSNAVRDLEDLDALATIDYHRLP